MKLNRTCPFCQFSNLSRKKRDESYLTCPNCKTNIFQNEDDSVGSYFYQMIHTNDALYCFCFYFDDPEIGQTHKFNIECYDKGKDNNWKVVLELKEHPNINLRNVKDKLRTILTFL